MCCSHHLETRWSAIRVFSNQSRLRFIENSNACNAGEVQSKWSTFELFRSAADVCFVGQCDSRVLLANGGKRTFVNCAEATMFETIQTLLGVFRYLQSRRSARQERQQNGRWIIQVRSMKDVAYSRILSLWMR